MKSRKIISVFLSLVITALTFAVPAGAGKIKVAAPTGVSVSVKSETSVKVTWDAVENADGYIVYYSTEKDDGYLSCGKTAKTHATLKRLTADTKYYFRVKAFQTIDGKKIKSDYSKTVSATPKAPKITDKNWDNYKIKYKYWMNPKSYKVHHCWCRTLKHYENFIGTDSLEYAQNKGYDLCGVCFR